MRAAIRRHPLVAFFTLAFGLSWIAWTPYVLSENGIGLLPFAFPRLLGTTQLLGVLPGAYLGPLTSAFVVTTIVGGRDALRTWGHRLVRFRVRWYWYAVALLGTPITILLTTAAFPVSWGHVAAPALAAASLYPAMLGLQVVTTGLAEEPGWRDFALPRLQGLLRPVPGTVVLGIFWGMWHLPLFFTEWGGWPDIDPLYPIEFVSFCVPLSLVMTWVFNRSGQSLPIVILLHSSINATYSLLWPLVFPTITDAVWVLHTQFVASTAVALMLIAVTRGRLGLSVESTPSVVDDRVTEPVTVGRSG